MEKKCRSCGETKSVDEFWKSKRYASGRLARCRTCLGAISHAIYEKHSEKRKAKQKEWYRKNRDKARETQRRYFRDNFDEIRAYQRKWYFSNAERNREKRKAWYLANRDKPHYRKLVAKHQRRFNKVHKYDARLCAGRAVYWATKCGALKKLPCSICGFLKVEAHHHNGYALEFWFDVVWLCRQHHNDAHGKESHGGVFYEFRGHSASATPKET